MKISLVMPSNNNKFFKWGYKYIRQNQGNHEVFICSIADNCKDDTNEYFKELAKKDDHFKYIINDTGEDWGCAYGYNKIIKELVTTDVFMIFHTDMYLVPGTLDVVEKNIKRKKVLSITRLEPPLHPAGDEKIILPYGDDIDNFDEQGLLKWIEDTKERYKGKTTHGAFAPFAAYKSDFEEIGYHDDINFRPFMFEDTDVYQRLMLNGCDLVQTWEGFVYHLTCRGWKFKDGVNSKLDTKDEQYYSNVNVKNARNFIRKWGHFLSHDKEMRPIITGRFNIGYVVHQLDEYTLTLLEPWCDTLYSDLDYEKYISIEQKNTRFDLRKKLKSLTDEKTNDVIVEFKLKDLTQESFNTLNLLQMIVKQTGKPGKFEQGIFKITINKIEDHVNDLIKLNDTYYLSKLISY